jgi:hypothetical protein
MLTVGSSEWEPAMTFKCGEKTKSAQGKLEIVFKG